MGTLFGLILCGLFVSTSILFVGGNVHSSPETAMRFSQCLIEKMGESNLFSFEDRDSMIEVSNVMAHTLTNQFHTKFPSRIVLAAFLTSMSDVIAHEDPIINAVRKSFYTAALEQCSIFTTGYIDREFIDLALGVLHSVESSKIFTTYEAGPIQSSNTGEAPTYGENINPERIDIFNPTSVHPSPVESPQNPGNLDSNEKSMFGPPDSGLSPIPVTPELSMDTEFKVQLETNSGISSDSQAGVASQEGMVLPSKPLPLSVFSPESSAADIGKLSQSPQPSPVVSPQDPEHFDSNDKKMFELSESGFSHFPVTPELNMNTEFKMQPETNTGISSGSQEGVASQEGMVLPSKTLPVSAFVPESSTADIGKFSQSAFDFGVLNIPQTKESSVVVISPVENEKFIQTDSLTKPFSETSELTVQPVKDKEEVSMPQDSMSARILPEFPSIGGIQVQNIPETKESVVLPAVSEQSDHSEYPLRKPETELQPGGKAQVPGESYLAVSPEFDSSGVQDKGKQSYPSLDYMIFNILMESETFRTAFHSDVPQDKAMILLITCLGKSLDGYSLDVVNDILTVFARDNTGVEFHAPENYAAALSNALTPVLETHNLPLFPNGIEIATRFLTNLENTKQTSSQEEKSEIKEESAAENPYANPEWSKIQSDFDSPPLEPEDTEGEIFSEVLAQYLNESKELSNFFCSRDVPESKLQIYFSIIKSSLADYGHHVPSLAASIASGVLSDFSKEELCSLYAQAISETIADVLNENGLLEDANAKDISNKMVFGLSQQVFSTESQKTETTEVQPQLYKTTAMPDDAVPTSKFSFASDFDDDSVTSTSVFKQTSVDYVTTSEDINFKTTDYFSGETYNKDTESPSFGIPSDPNEEPSITDYRENTGLVTTTYTTEITDEDFASAGTLEGIITSSSEAPPTESFLDWAPGDTVDQAKLAAYLLEELESVLDSCYHESTELKTDEIPSIDEAEGDFTAQKPSPSSLQLTQNGEKDNLPQSASSAKNSDYESFSPKVNDGTFIKDTRKDNVELQPSFREPQVTEYPTQMSVSKFRDEAYHDGPEDPLTTMSTDLTLTATSSVDFIRSGHFDLNNLCYMINKFAPIVNIPPLTYCGEIPAIDYLLNVLKSTVKMFHGV